MIAAVDELKVRARLRLNALRDAGQDARLRDCLTDVARHAGFMHWEHARRVLSGEAATGDDMGTFWWAPACAAYLSEWHADLQVAKQALEKGKGERFLVPYRRQFAVVPAGYVRDIGIDPASPEWAALGCDLVAGYGSAAWRQLCMQRLRASMGSFARS